MERRKNPTPKRYLQLDRVSVSAILGIGSFIAMITLLLLQWAGVV